MKKISRMLKAFRFWLDYASQSEPQYMGRVRKVFDEDALKL